MDDPKGTPWTREEVEATVAVYFRMLGNQLAGMPYSKTELNKELGLTVKRSLHSIERKHGNISAILIELGYGYVSGYKPWFHYQNLLRTVVEEWLLARPDLDLAISSSVQKPVIAAPPITDLLAMQVIAPKTESKAQYVSEKTPRPPSPFRRNYLELEAKNSSLGRAGEELILKFEQHRLWAAGERKLADKIERVSDTRGDGLGFDILSFELDGRERLIEVKTTRFGSLTPFFVSKSEVRFSVVRETDYQLYRVFSFDSDPRFYSLAGALGKSCALDAVSFSATPL